jgi:hypothetical protein
MFMATAITRSDLDNILKRYYAKRMEKLVFNAKMRPFLSMVPKQQFGGNMYVHPIQYEYMTGRSHSFSIAQANANASKYVQLQVDEDELVPFYGSVYFSTRALRAAGNDPYSYIKQQALKFDDILEGLANDMETALFGLAYEYIGYVSSASDAGTYTTVTLSNAGDALKFEVGMKIDFSTYTSGLTPTTYTVRAVDYNAGTVQLTVDDVSATCAAKPYMFVQGNSNYASGLTLGFCGLQTLIPSTAPTDTLFNIDRSLNPVRLGGNRFTGDLGAIENSIFDALVGTHNAVGNHGDFCFVNSTLWGALAKEMGQDVQRRPQEGVGGWSTLTIRGPVGDVKIVSAPKCPANLGYVLKMDSFKLLSLGEPLSIFDDDGIRVLRAATEDAMEVRASGFSQLCCVRPGDNTVIAFS